MTTSDVTTVMDYHSLYNSTEKFRKTLAKWLKWRRCRLKRHFRTKKSRRRAVYIFGGVVIFVLVMGLASAHSENRTLQQNFIDRQIRLHNLQGKLKELQTEKAATQSQLQDRDKRLQDTQKQIDDLNKQLQAKAARRSLLATLSPQTASAASSHADWLAAAGIPTSDWASVDYIVEHESGWNYTAVNYLGATGLCQSLPGVKMASAGADYLTNPVTQLRWCDSYAHQRFGGWANAAAYWRSHHNW